MQRFKAARELAGLSQKYVSISLGIAQPSVSDWENGKSNPTLDNLVAMSSLYGVSIDFLLGVTDEPGLSPFRNKKQPVISDDELRRLSLLRVQTLPCQALPHLLDFLDGLEAGRAIGSKITGLPASNIPDAS